MTLVEHTQEIMLGYCFVIFGIFFGLNYQTILSMFGGFGSGIFIGIHAIFMGFFLSSYLKEKINLKGRLDVILETLYLTIVGVFSMAAIFVPSILLTLLSKSDLTRKFVSSLSTTSGITNSTLNSFLMPQSDMLAGIGIYIISIYFAVLFFLYYVRHLPRKMHHPTS